MSTSRPFAYNLGGSPISGTEQVGNLAIGTPTNGFDSTGLQWWNGPNEDLGYVIAHQTPGGNQPNPLSIPAYLGFWRSNAKTDQSFIDLAEYVSYSINSPQNFTGGTQAKTWLNANGYWTSYGQGGGSGSTTGDYYLLNQYSPAVSAGSITFPDANLNQPSLNPNLVGQHGYEIYINKFDFNNNDMSATLDNLVGRSGTFTLTQGVNSATYSFTSNAFAFGGPYPTNYWWGDVHNPSSPANAITLTSASPSNFDTINPITITVS